MREDEVTKSVYVVLLTGRGGLENRVAGLRGGADDYLTKPYDVDELAARLMIGRRIAELQDRLRDRVAELERMAIVQTLERTRWNKRAAAHSLGMYRPTLYSKLKKYKIYEPRPRGPRKGDPPLPNGG